LCAVLLLPLGAVAVLSPKLFDLWRDNLDERRATIRMRIVSRSGAMIVAARHERKPFNVPERRSR
jgi:hypothetical protein